MVSTAGMFGDDDFPGMSKRLTEQMMAMTEPHRKMQKSIARMFEPYDRLNKQLQKSIARMLEPYDRLNQRMQESIARIVEPYVRLNERMRQTIRPILDMQQALQRTAEQMTAPLRAHQDTMRRLSEHFAADQHNTHGVIEEIVAKLLPAEQIQRQMDSILSQILKGQGETLAIAAQTVSENLADYSPSIESTSEAIVIDGNALTPADLGMAIVRDDALSSPARWQQLPNWLQWLLLAILSILLGAIWNCIAYGQVPFAHRRHEHKTAVHQAKVRVRSEPQREYLPFVMRDQLLVYASPRRHSRRLDELPFATEVRILRFRKKKRWALIEWSLGEETRRGWVLARYVFRPSKFRPSECKGGAAR